MRALAWSAAVLVLLADAAMLGSTDASYRGQAMFNVLFFRLGPAGVDLQPLGVRSEELRYRGMNAYTQGAPAANRAWTEEFGRRTGFVRLAGWYVRHPASTARIPDGDAEEWRSRDAPRQPEQFPGGGWPGSGCADRSISPCGATYAAACCAGGPGTLRYGTSFSWWVVRQAGHR